MFNVHVHANPEPLHSFPFHEAGIAVVSIVIGDSDAVGWSTSTNAIGLPYGDEPMGCWIWGKWGTGYVADRYTCPTRLYDKFVPLTVGTGAHPDGSTATTIGPEHYLAAKRLEQLKLHRGFTTPDIQHYTIKFAVPGSTAAPRTSPRASWAVEREVYPYPLLPQEEAAIADPHSNANMLITEYLWPAILDLQLAGKLVLIDAVYINLGTNDCVADETLKEAPRNLALHLSSLVGELEDSLMINSLPTVVSLPRFNAAHAPTERVELARQQIERWADEDVRVHIVKIDDLGVQRDLVHLTARSQVGHGMRWAQVWDSNVTNLYEPTLPIAKNEDWVPGDESVGADEPDKIEGEFIT